MRSRELQRAEEVVRARMDPLLDCAGLVLKHAEQETASGVLRLTVAPIDPGEPAIVASTPAVLAERVAAVEVLLSAALSRAGLPADIVLVVLESPTAAVGPADLSSAIRELASRVARTGRPCAVGPMSSFDRRRVHEAVGQVPEVWSRSEGEGLLRRLWILPRAHRGGRGSRSSDPVGGPESVE